ncbi:MAG: hypothetical protein ABXS93_08535 [Sulfurimonas sp.]
MKMREFTIQTDKLEYLGYAKEELSLGLVAEHLCEELEVPEEFIEDLNLNDDHLSIKLTDKVRYFNEDWYVNIQRIA